MKRNIGLILYAVCIYVLLIAMQRMKYEQGYYDGKMSSNKLKHVVKDGNVLKYPFNPKATAELNDELNA